MIKNCIAAALASTALVAASGTAFAQTIPASPADGVAAQQNTQGEDTSASTAEPQDQSGDIIVTAQKRAERLQDVPQSITVATQADLQRQQVNTVADLSRIAPALEILTAPQQNTGGGGQIRGIGTQTFNAGAVGAVGIVVDQVSQGNANISDLFDIARVEVLKGPQGTLFGLTTSAGVINITTNAPDPTRFSGRARTELSADGVLGTGFGLQLVQGLLNIPVSENAALRVSGNARLRQGTNRNALDGSIDTHQSYTGRGRLLWKPTDRTTVNVIGDYTQSRDNGSDFFTVVQADAATTAQLAACGVTVREGNASYCTDTVTINRQKNFGGSVQVDYDAEPFTLTSITSYRGTRLDAGIGDVVRIKSNPVQILSGPGGGTQVDLYNQELRIASPSAAKLEYTVGLFVSRQSQHQNPEPLRVLLSPAPGVTIPLVNSLGLDTNVTDESMAIFGQANFHLTDRFTLIGGGRYTGQRLAVNQVSQDTLGVSQGKVNIDNFSWKVGGQYEFSRDLMAYVTASRGYKGPQLTFPTQGGPAVIIRPEIPMNYEGGVKANLLGNLVQMDFSVFRVALKDYQGQECAPDPTTNGLRCFQVNLDKVVSKGVELNLSGRPVEGLIVTAGGIYNKVSYPDDYIGADGSALAGEQLAYAPKLKFTLSGEYSHAVTSGTRGFIGGDAVYKSKIRTDATADPTQEFRAHWLVGGRVGIRSETDAWSLAVFARNLGNVHEPTLLFRNFPQAGSTGAIYGTQSFRQVGLQLDARF